jgi:hypothetical protein
MVSVEFGRPVGGAVIVAALVAGACGSSDTRATAPSVPALVRETVAGTISATTSTSCSATFVASVHPTYYSGGTQRCMEYQRRWERPGLITGDLRWQDSRIDLDLVLNDGAGTNYLQSIGANKCCESVRFSVSAQTDYTLIIYLRGVDPQFVANGGIFIGPVSTAFTLTVDWTQ